MKLRVFANTTFVFALSLGAQLSLTAQQPRTFLIDAPTLAAQISHPDPEFLKLVRHDADNALRIEPMSLTNQKGTPPSGDKRDYVSMARYFWPNPATPNHMPYIQKDGQTNPEIHNYPGHEWLDATDGAARSLALGYAVTHDEKYAEHAALLIRTFFLDPKTGMKPNLDFAQFVPGKNTGRGTGILDARSLVFLVDALGMLPGSKSWKPEDDAAMKTWLAAYYKWLRTTDAGHQEENAVNNHGSWYTAQASAIAMYLGKTDDAKAIAQRIVHDRIPDQIAANGDQKYELKRTNSFSYSAFNLEALTQTAAIVSTTGVDLYKSKPGILTALDALLPFDAQHPWPHEQISSGHEDSICPALIRAAAYTKDAKYLEAQKRFACKLNAVSWLESHKL